MTVLHGRANGTSVIRGERVAYTSRMVARNPTQLRVPRYSGLRMTADDYLALADDGFRYELIDGVVVMTPSPTPEHQDIRGEIEWQMRGFVRQHAIGRVLSEVDVRLNDELVYRPDMIFISRARMARMPKKITAIPELMVEVLSESSTALDQHTKLADYQRFGVEEYWLVDVVNHSIRFLRLVRGTYIEVKATQGRFASEAVPGFVLDVAAVLGLCTDSDDE